jgi:hypothetical protein
MPFLAFSHCSVTKREELLPRPWRRDTHQPPPRLTPRGKPKTACPGRQSGDTDASTGSDPRPHPRRQHRVRAGCRSQPRSPAALAGQTMRRTDRRRRRPGPGRQDGKAFVRKGQKRLKRQKLGRRNRAVNRKETAARAPGGSATNGRPGGQVLGWLNRSGLGRAKTWAERLAGRLRGGQEG